MVKEDDLLTKQDILNHPKEVSAALLTELKIWLDTEQRDNVQSVEDAVEGSLALLVFLSTVSSYRAFVQFRNMYRVYIPQ